MGRNEEGNLVDDSILRKVSWKVLPNRVVILRRSLLDLLKLSFPTYEMGLKCLSWMFQGLCEDVHQAFVTYRIANIHLFPLDPPSVNR